MKTTNMNTTYWQDEDGTVKCHNHLGTYGTAALSKNPNRNTISTPITDWVKMTGEDLADWTAFLAEHGHTEACETCRHG